MNRLVNQIVGLSKKINQVFWELEESHRVDGRVYVSDLERELIKVSIDHLMGDIDKLYHQVDSFKVKK